MTRLFSTYRLSRGMFFLLLSLLSPLAGAKEVPTTPVGIEGSIVVTLPGPEAQAVPVTHSSELILRIGSVEQKDDTFIYELHYLGTEPGRYNLANYLIHKNNLPVITPKPIYVDIKNQLASRHSGALSVLAPAPIADSKWYSFLMPALIALWFLLLYPLFFYKRKKTIPVPVPEHIPSLAERLQPLVIKASEGDLTLQDKAHLEGLMLLFWCDKLQLEKKNISASLSKLKQDAVAGQLMRAIEGWLHKPPGREQVDLAELMAPYKNVTSEDIADD